jgi:hypothetical protein
MQWFKSVLSVLAQLGALHTYARWIGIVFGLLLVLIGIPFNAMAIVILGGCIAATSAFWPRGKNDADT